MQELPTHVSALRGLFAGHDAFDLLTGLLLIEAEQASRAPKRRDAFFDGLMAGETAAMVLLERPGRTGAGEPQATLAETLARCTTHLMELTERTGQALSRMWHLPAGDALAAMQDRFIRGYLFTPINDTDEQASVWLHDLFADADVESWLSEKLGFGANAADELVRATQSILLERSQAGPVEVREGIGERFAMAAPELAARAGVDASIAEVFCRQLSNRFGQPLPTWPALPTTIRHRPLIDDGEGRYFLVAPPMLRRGLRYTLAAALNPAIPEVGTGDQQLYQCYLTRRSALVETRALATLETLLRPQLAVKNLHFRTRGGRRLEGEIDGLLVLDGIAIVIQAKSAPTRIDVLASDSEAFRGMLRGILGESMRQHDDARQALGQQSAEIEFWVMERGRRTAVDVPVVREVLPVTVTLDDLSGSAPVSWQLRDAGLATIGVLPWVVAVTELETMISLLEYPAQLIQFLRRRVLLNTTRNLAVIDEIDIFLEYLNDHLEIVHGRTEHDGHPAALMPPERFHELDSWLHAKREGRTRPPPQQKLPVRLRPLLDRLDQDRPPGWLAFSVAALDLRRHDRKRLGQLAKRALNGNSKPAQALAAPSLDGKRVDFVFIVDPESRRIDEQQTRSRILAQARSEGVSSVYALVVPREPKLLRLVWSGPLDPQC